MESDKIIFRYLTPIFKQNEFTNFQHSGVYKDATYSISIKGYGLESEPSILPHNDLDELFKYGTENTLRNLWNMHQSDKFFPPDTNVILVVDVEQPLVEARKVSGNTIEGERIFQGIVSALRLHTSAGLTHEYTYLFRSPPISALSLDDMPEVIRELTKQSPGCAIFRPHSVPTSSPLRMEMSSLPADQHDACRATFQRLLEKEWGYTNTFDTVLSLALEYHRTSFALEKIEQAFLLLMVVFEALFKKDHTENAIFAAERIATLLAPAKADCLKIEKEFVSGSSTDDFCKTRNKIAHGDPGLDYRLVATSYPKLYRYITDGLISLINLPTGAIGTNYYNDLTNYVNTRYSGLPDK